MSRHLEIYEAIFGKRPMKIEVYSIPNCIHCETVKNLTILKGYTYTEYDMADLSPKQWRDAIGSVPRTAPQVFVNDKHVGGCEDFIIAMREVENI